MNKQFIANHSILTITVPLIGLCLFDGTCNSIISQAAEILIHLLTGLTLVIRFFVTSLNSSCSAVLGYDLPRQYNPLIDWSTGQILFHSAEHRGPAPSTSHRKADSLPHPSEPLELTPMITLTPKSSTSISPLQISLINAPAYLCTVHLPGLEVFQLSLTREGTYGKHKASLIISPF